MEIFAFETFISAFPFIDFFVIILVPSKTQPNINFIIIRRKITLKVELKRIKQSNLNESLLYQPIFEEFNLILLNLSQNIEQSF